jgi:phosphoglycerate dehydrogenase-like enzyme
MAQNDSFRVAITDDGVYDRIMAVESARDPLENAPHIEIARFSGERGLVDARDLDQYDALIAGGPIFTRESLEGVKRCALIIRYGAGYDRVDVEACTEAGVILATTPDGIRRPMATAALIHILALSTRLFFKSALIYEDRWAEAASMENYGTGLSGKTIGYIGFGNIGRDLYKLIKPFDMHHLVYDPYLDETTARQHQIERAGLSTVLARADFVVTLCTLTEETRHLIGAEQLRQMKNSAYLVNVARGAIIDQQALVRALGAKEIRGAGLDALDPEPIAPDDPLLGLDNVNLTPHALGITDEMVRRCSELCVQGTLDVMRGEAPASVINRAVLDEDKLRHKLVAYRQRFG